MLACELLTPERKVSAMVHKYRRIRRSVPASLNGRSRLSDYKKSPQSGLGATEVFAPCLAYCVRNELGGNYGQHEREVNFAGEMNKLWGELSSRWKLRAAISGSTPPISGPVSRNESLILFVSVFHFCLLNPTKQIANGERDAIRVVSQIKPVLFSAPYEILRGNWIFSGAIFASKLRLKSVA